jgi:hypothetical protein
MGGGSGRPRWSPLLPELLIPLGEAPEGEGEAPTIHLTGGLNCRVCPLKIVK